MQKVVEEKDTKLAHSKDLTFDEIIEEHSRIYSPEWGKGPQPILLSLSIPATWRAYAMVIPSFIGLRIPWPKNS
jgi:hypothetical protein